MRVDDENLGTRHIVFSDRIDYSHNGYGVLENNLIDGHAHHPWSNVLPFPDKTGV